MTQIRREGGGYVTAIDTADGSTVLPDDSGYCALTSGHTYVFVLGGTTDALCTGVHIQTDSAIAFSSTGALIDVSNLPRNSNAGATARNDQVTDYSTTTGDWVPYNPSTAYIPTVGTGWTVTNMTLTKTAAVGAAFIDIGNSGARRTRLRVVVTTTGKLRVNHSGKD